MVGRNYDTRFGNGIEIFGACDGFTAENNYVYQCYDTGITVSIILGSTVTQAGL
jgi:hypothetical protein